MKKIVFLMVLMLAANVNAYTITFAVRDLNTLQPIAGANISVHHIDLAAPDSQTFHITDANGYAISFDNELEHWINISKIGYYTHLNGFVNVTNDTEVISYLTPISTEGLVRVVWTDDTINMPERKICAFYSENGRLVKCYGKNETIWLMTNHGYDFQIQTNFYDQVTSIDSIWENKFNLMPMLGLIFILIYVLMKVINKK